MIFSRAVEKRSLAKEKRGFPAVKQCCAFNFTEYRRGCHALESATHKNPPKRRWQNKPNYSHAHLVADSQPKWPPLRKKSLSAVNMASDDSAGFNIRYFTSARASHSTIESHGIQNAKLKRN